MVLILKMVFKYYRYVIGLYALSIIFFWSSINVTNLSDHSILLCKFIFFNSYSLIRVLYLSFSSLISLFMFSCYYFIPRSLKSYFKFLTLLSFKILYYVFFCFVRLIYFSFKSSYAFLIYYDLCISISYCFFFNRFYLR